MYELVLYVSGAMWSGKSSRLLLEANLHRHSGRRVVAFKPKMDDRYSSTEICTHNGLVSLASTPIETGDDIERAIASLELTDREVSRTTVVLDEAFMVSGAARSLIWLYRHGFSVLVSSLDISSSLKPFEEVVQLLPWATRVEKCTAACETCGGIARFTWKKIVDEGTILVGGSDVYSPRCFSCHPLLGGQT